MRWATRTGVHIDRAGCAWLIRRFIDPAAEFVFVTDPGDVPADATAFDIRGAELSHHGTDRTFETLLRRYELTDPVLWKIAEIVHERTLTTTGSTPPEAPGMDVILRGLSMTGTDAQTLAVADPIFAGLYEGGRYDPSGKSADRPALPRVDQAGPATDVPAGSAQTAADHTPGIWWSAASCRSVRHPS